MTEQCEFFNSENVTKYPSSGGDGVHYWGKGKRIARENGHHWYLKNLTSLESMKKIALGAGCFWGVEAAFKLLPGIIKTRVGYMGGRRVPNV